MTEQAKSIILDAFEDIVSGVDEDSMESSDAMTAIRALNRLMSSLSAEGVSLGYSNVRNTASLVTVPDGAIDPIISLLAYRLWPKYRSVPMSAGIASNARVGLKLLYKLGGPMAAMEYPSTLPMGSGNTGDSETAVFYSNLESTILSETNASISLEDDTDV